MQRNKAIVGRNAFAHESGIHQDGMLKERSTYEIMDPRTSASTPTDLVLGKHSGRHALRSALQELGYQLDGQALNTAFKRFKEIADKKKQVTAMDLEALVTDELREAMPGLLAGVVRRRGLLAPPAARDGRPAAPPTAPSVQGSFTGDGPSTRCSARSTRPAASTRGCASSASTRSPAGQDALGEVSVVVELGDQAAQRVGLPGVLLRERATGAGQAVATDIIEAAGIAYVRALTNAVHRVQALAAAPQIESEPVATP